jgi:chromosome segregation ATPase
MSILDEDFSRLFSLVSSLANVTAKNTEDITRIETSVQSLVNVTSIHQQTLELYQQRYEQDQQRYEQDQQRYEQDQQRFNAVLTEIQRQGDEIRGLQTENRRILDILINRTE